MRKYNVSMPGQAKYLPAITAVLSFMLLCLAACTAMAGTGDKIYVALDQDVAVVDPNTLDAWGSIKTGNTTCRLKLSPDRKLVYATVYGDNKVKAIDVSTDTVVKEASISSGPYVLDITPDGNRLLVGTEKGLTVVDTGTFTETGSLDLGGMTQAIRVSPDGSKAYLVSGDPDTELVVVDIKGMKTGRETRLPRQVYDMVMSPDGRTLYASSTAESKVVVIDTAELRATGEVAAYGDFGLALSRDGSELWIPGPDMISVYSLKDKKAVAKLPFPKGDGLRRAAFSADGTQVFAWPSGDERNLIEVYDAATRKKTGEIKVESLPRDVLYIQK